VSLYAFDPDRRHLVVVWPSTIGSAAHVPPQRRRAAPPAPASPARLQPEWRNHPGALAAADQSLWPAEPRSTSNVRRIHHPRTRSAEMAAGDGNRTPVTAAVAE
jgi:hypothetical protein